MVLTSLMGCCSLSLPSLLTCSSSLRSFFARTCSVGQESSSRIIEWKEAGSTRILLSRTESRWTALSLGGSVRDRALSLFSEEIRLLVNNMGATSLSSCCKPSLRRLKQRWKAIVSAMPLAGGTLPAACARR